MKRLGIQSRVLIAMMAVIGGFVALTSWIVDGLVDRFLEAEIRGSIARGKDACARFLDVRNEVLLDQARSVAQAPHLRAVLDTPDVDAQTVEFTLDALASAVEAPLMFVADGRGRLLADTRDGARGDERLASAALERALQGRESCEVIDYAGQPHLVAVCPVALDSAVLGVLGIGSPLADHVADLRKVTGLDVTVLREGQSIASASHDESSSATAASLVGFDSELPARLESDGRAYMAVAIPLARDERLVLSRPLGRVLAHFADAKNEILATGLVVALIALVVSRSIAGRIGRPIRELTTAADALARGELSTVVRGDGPTEVGELARAFNTMARQLEASLEGAMQKARAAEQANAAKSVFLATMSHELRTPLNGVLGFAEQLMQSSTDERQREQARMIQRSGEELLAIIDDVLTISHLDSSALRLEAIDFDPRACFERVLAEARPMLEAKRLEARLEVDARTPALLSGPRDRIAQIARHLVSNAVKFTSAGSVEVRVSLAGETPDDVLLRVEVEDTGIGIAPDRFERLFQPFAQLDAGRNRRYGGAGLGLAICRELASKMGGETGLSSTLGAGSKFWFTARLARCRPSASVELLEHPRAPMRSTPSRVEGADAPSGDAQRPAWRARQRILVAEDNLVNQKVTCAMLKNAGWSFAVAANGLEAVELVARERFDLILMDCQMPTMDGLEATRRIRETEASGSQRIPIVALTANALPSDREACFASGMDGFLSKPLKSADLVRELDLRLGPAARA